MQEKDTSIFAAVFLEWNLGIKCWILKRIDYCKVELFSLLLSKLKDALLLLLRMFYFGKRQFKSFRISFQCDIDVLQAKLGAIIMVFSICHLILELFQVVILLSFKFCC